MKKLLIFLIGIILFTSCKTETLKNENIRANVNSESKNNGLIAVDYSVNPGSVKANEPAEMTFTVKNSAGETIREMEIVHEKLIHLLVVSEDLQEFYHLHPEQQSDGSFKASFSFPNGGYYRIYADLKPKGGEQLVKNFTQTVVGNERPKVPLKVDEKFEKTVGGLRVVMKPDAALESGKDAMLNFEVFDAATNQPVTDLEKYLGEYAHFVIISEDLRDFVHAHPMSKDNVKSEEHSHDSNAKRDDKFMNQNAEAIVSAHVAFPNAAKYKIWAQFQRGGKVIDVPFVVEVKQGKSEKTLTDVKIPDGAYKVVVSKDGFAPEEISYKKGQPLKFAFVRIDEQNCGDEVVFKDLNIRKKLPVGEVVTVDVPTDKSGEINFACGMDMFKGKIVIE